MRRKLRDSISVTAGLIVLALLIWLTVVTRPDPAKLLPGIFFSVLIVSTTTLGLSLAGGTVSLLPMTTLAACLVMGPVPTGWAAFVGALIYGLIRYRWAEWLDLPQEPDRMGIIAVTAANTVMHTISILVAGAGFQLLGGITPLVAVDLPQIPALASLGLTYLGVNYLIVGIYIGMRGRRPLQLYLRTLPNLLLYEGAPMVFAPLAALIYTQLGVGQFVLFACILVIASLIARDIALTSRRLQRRVRELDSLQAVGQALSASLNVEAVVLAIYAQVVRLMLARSFYVALYDPETDEVSFPLVVEDNRRVQWPSRRAGNGLTEYILRTRAPLLIGKDVGATLKKLGIDEIGRPALSWLGVPLLAGPEPLGVIAVQSHSTPGAYDTSHQEVLVTIAAQAAAAIQNARLYARTDEALARRVQELNSILRTTREGILLLDPDWRVLAVNRALADFMGVAQVELMGKSLDDLWPAESETLSTLLGDTPADLRADCAALVREERTGRQMLVVSGPPERHVERVLTPVRDREGAITGWLLVFRDVTEEVELARLKDDMTSMLVHDLRSPLMVLQGSLGMVKAECADKDMEKLGDLLGLAQHSSDRVLRMVNDLLDISKLEEGQLPLQLEVVEAKALLEDTAARLAPLATSAQITVEVETEPNLPPLYVDPQLIGRALNNLLDNAIKFTPDGGHVRLWARVGPEGVPTALLVGVSDTGPGVPSADQHRLFQKFQRATTAAGRRAGTGLGLPFCKLAVEAHGGKIWVESVVGEGSTFVMRLPTVG